MAQFQNLSEAVQFHLRCGHGSYMGGWRPAPVKRNSRSGMQMPEACSTILNGTGDLVKEAGNSIKHPFCPQHRQQREQFLELMPLEDESRGRGGEQGGDAGQD